MERGQLLQQVVVMKEDKSAKLLLPAVTVRRLFKISRQLKKYPRRVLELLIQVCDDSIIHRYSIHRYSYLSRGKITMLPLSASSSRCYQVVAIEITIYFNKYGDPNHNGLMFTLKQNLPVLKYIKQLMQGAIADDQLIAEARARAQQLGIELPQTPAEAKASGRTCLLVPFAQSKRTRYAHFLHAAQRAYLDSISAGVARRTAQLPGSRNTLATVS